MKTDRPTRRWITAALVATVLLVAPFVATTAASAAPGGSWADRGNDAPVLESLMSWLGGALSWAVTPFQQLSAADSGPADGTTAQTPNGDPQGCMACDAGPDSDPDG